MNVHIRVTAYFDIRIHNHSIFNSQNNILFNVYSFDIFSYRNMSCVDVVYQSLQRHPFFQYLKNSENGDEVRAEDLSTGGGVGVKQDDDQSDSGSDKESIPEAEYVSAKCVIFTYFTGDTNKVVDDHFTKALNRPSSFTADMTRAKESGSYGNDINNNNKGPLMSQRVFPPSFWSSNYYNIKRNYNIHSDLSSIQEAMLCDTSVGPNANNVWQYSLSQGAYSHHRPIAELGYGVSSSNCGVFNPRYSSLLIQPPVRASRLPGLEAGQCDSYTKPSDPGWSIAYTNPHGEYSSYAFENAATTSMTNNQDSTKDPLWF